MNDRILIGISSQNLNIEFWGFKKGQFYLVGILGFDNEMIGNYKYQLRTQLSKISHRELQIW